jgi:hypothetical protein
MSEVEELVETVANQNDCRTQNFRARGLPVIFYQTI